MRILLSGSHGTIGSALSAHLLQRGHEVARLVRRQAVSQGEVYWSIEAGRIDSRGLEGFDAVIHLAGESIAGRWTEQKKQQILHSRADGTALLAGALAELDDRPRSLLSASAMGYYGDAGDQWLTEDSPPGNSFLAEVCRQWEAACEPARQAGIRVVNMRMSMVLDSHSGAMASMLPAFKACLGGRIGSGNQYWSWATLADTVAGIYHMLLNDVLVGPVNLSAEPVTNRHFTAALAQALNRPGGLTVPAFAARLRFGQMADELLLTSARLSSRKLQASGFSFASPTIEQAMTALLG